MSTYNKIKQEVIAAMKSKNSSRLRSVAFSRQYN